MLEAVGGCQMQWEVVVDVRGNGRLWVDVRRNGGVMGGFEGQWMWEAVGGFGFLKPFLICLLNV